MHELNVLLKIEFKRLFKNKLFYISLFIGVVLATGSFINKVIPHRSEERRVGKECRSRWSPYH